MGSQYAPQHPIFFDPVDPDPPAEPDSGDEPIHQPPRPDYPSPDIPHPEPPMPETASLFHLVVEGARGFRPTWRED
jgi:hypothetical protein